MKRLGRGEGIVMNILWSSQTSLTVSEIQKLTPEYSKAVIAEILKNLVKKKVVEIDDIRIVKKSLSRFYKPIVSEEDYFLSIIPEKALSRLVSNFVTRNKNSKEVKELYKMLHNSFNKNEVI